MSPEKNRGYGSLSYLFGNKDKDIFNWGTESLDSKIEKLTTTIYESRVSPRDKERRELFLASILELAKTIESGEGNVSHSFDQFLNRTNDFLEAVNKETRDLYADR